MSAALHAVQQAVSDCDSMPLPAKSLMMLHTLALASLATTGRLYHLCTMYASCSLEEQHVLGLIVHAALSAYRGAL